MGIAILAGLSLGFARQPTYDPYAWLVWGRELLHGHLATAQGPSWKPLPVLIDTGFALVGGLAPILWMLVARAAFLVSLIYAWRLGWRWGGRAAGGLAVVLIGLAPWLLTDVALGASEGLVVLCCLALVDRHLAGRDLQGWGWGVALALLRPESWPFLGVFWLGLMVARRLRPATLVVGAAVVAALWLVPEKLGSGSYWRAADRALGASSVSAADDRNPVAVLEQALRLASPVVVVGLAVLAVLLVRRRVAPDARRPLVLMGTVAAGWTLLVALMTVGGFSGNSRYLFVPLAYVSVLAAVGLARLARTLTVALPLGGALLAVVVVLGVTRTDVRNLPGIASDVRERAAIAGELDAAADAASQRPGAQSSCPPIRVPGYYVPIAAWRFGLAIEDVQTGPGRVGSGFSAPEPTDPTAEVQPLVTSARADVTRTGQWLVASTCVVGSGEGLRAAP